MTHSAYAITPPVMPMLKNENCMSHAYQMLKTISYHLIIQILITVSLSSYITWLNICMTFYCTTQQLQHSVWTLEGTITAPTSSDWDYTLTPGVDSIKWWEVVEHIPGVATVAAAHDPFCEYYVIVSRLQGVATQEFFGTTASDRCSARASELGIDLSAQTQTTTLYTSTAKL